MLIATGVSLIFSLAHFASTSGCYSLKEACILKLKISVYMQLLCCGGRVVHNYNFQDICCLLSCRIQQTTWHM